MSTKLIGAAAPFSAWKYSSQFLSVTTIYQIMPVLIRHKILGGGGFQFIWFHSWKRIMNRLFASLPVPNWPRGRRQKAKWWRQKRADRQKIVTKTKRIIRPFASVKKDKKPAKNGSSTSKLIRKVLWIGAAVAQGHLDSALWAHWSARLAGVSSIGSSQEDVLSRSNVFCASAGGDD